MVLAAEPLQGASLSLDPLRVVDAEELAPLLADVELYRFIGGKPPDLAAVRSRFDRQTRGISPDGREAWLNWVIRTGVARHAAGTFQATVTDGDKGAVAELAWVIATADQGQGLATAAAVLVAGWLDRRGVQRLRAHIHPEHRASEAVAASIGLSPSTLLVRGERRWQRPPG